MRFRLGRAIQLGVVLIGTLAAGWRIRADVVVPSSGFLNNGIGDEFHTDVRVFNPTDSPVVMTPVFYRQPNTAAGLSAGTVTAPDVTVPPRGQAAFDNVLQSVFGQSTGAFGPIRFQTTAPLVVSSATNNVNGCNHTGAIQGQWIPGLDVSSAMTNGTLVQLATSTSPAAGYRSNLVFFHPAPTGSANVTVNLRAGDGTLISTGSFTLGNGPGGFKQVNSFKDFSPAVSLSDTNLWVEFTSDQPVLAFASVINNGSGDPYAVTASAEIPPAPVLPVASYTVSASPIAGQPATFTDTSSGIPTVQLWSFGDGATATSGATVQRTYAAAGTYKTAHFVGNAAGVSGVAQDVVVTPAPLQTIQITITASQSFWTPKNVNLKVGQPYQITFRIDPAVPSVHHGVDGPLALGGPGPPADCFFLNPSCVWNFTPTASMLNSPGPVYQYGCSQSTCSFGHDTMTAGAVNGGTITIVP